MNKEYLTFAGLVRHVAGTYGNAAAFGYKESGRWRHLSTESFIEQIRHLCLGLRELGVRKGDTVGILGTCSPFWLIADLAVMVMGGVSVPLFSESSEEEFKFKTENARLKYLFLFNPPAWPSVQRCSAIFNTIITRGIDVGHEKTVTYDDVLKKGASIYAAKPDSFEILTADVNENDPATIIYTSGSTGVSKGVKLSHRNLISQLHGSRDRFPLDPASDIALSCLPLAHSFERMIVYYYVASNVQVYFNDAIQRVGEDLREVQPTVMTVVPRILGKAREKFMSHIETDRGFKKIVGKWALARADSRDPETNPCGFKDRLADIWVYSRFRKAFGGKLRYVIVGGAAMPLKLYRFFVNVGFPLYQGYGMTEASPVLCVNYPKAHKIGTVGKPFPDVQIRISPEGEILAKGPNIMRGYHLLPEETSRMIDSEGWLHTGDLGNMDSGDYVTITGRAKELFKTSCGEYVAPVPIEQALCTSSLVDMAMVIGEGKDFVSCLLFPEFEYLKCFKASRGLENCSDREVLEGRDVSGEIEALLSSVNSKLNSWEQVKQYRFVLDRISVETGELTPTMKLRRHVALKKYEDLVTDMY